MNETLMKAFKLGFQKEAEFTEEQLKEAQAGMVEQFKSYSDEPGEEIPVGESGLLGAAVGGVGLPMADAAGLYKRFLPGANVPLSGAKGALGGLALGSLGATAYNYLNDEQSDSGMPKEGQVSKIKELLTGAAKNPDLLDNLPLSHLGSGAEGVAYKIDNAGDVLKDFNVAVGDGGAKARGAIMDHFNEAFPNIKAYGDGKIRMEELAGELGMTGNLDAAVKNIKNRLDNAELYEINHPMVPDVLGVQSSRGRAALGDLHGGNVGKTKGGEEVIMDPMLNDVEGFWGARGAQGVFNDIVPGLRPPDQFELLANVAGGETAANRAGQAFDAIGYGTRAGTLGAAGIGLQDLAAGAGQ